MKAIISQIDMLGGTLWEAEALSVTWDSENGEFVIRGDRDNRALTGVIISMMEGYKLTIEVEDVGPGLVVWRGHISSAKFQTSESGQVECGLIMSLDDWFGISTRSKSSPAYQMAKAR